MKLSDLKRLTAIWQERLKLLDWDVAVRWATKDEVKTGEDWAWAEFHAHEKRGEIVLTHPDLWTDDVDRKSRDLEVYVVHELSHLHFSPFNTEEGSAEETIEENIVNLYSRLLIAIDRRNDEITGRKFSKRASLAPAVPRATKKNKEVQLGSKEVVKETGSKEGISISGE